MYVCVTSTNMQVVKEVPSLREVRSSYRPAEETYMLVACV